MSWDKIIEKLANLDPKVAVRLSILDRQMSQGQVPPERIDAIIEEMNKLADAVLLDFDNDSAKAAQISPLSTAFSGEQCSRTLDVGGATISYVSSPYHAFVDKSVEPKKPMPIDSPHISTTE